MTSDSGGALPLSIDTTNNHAHLGHGLPASAPPNRSLHITSATTSPLISAPASPAARRPSHPATSPSAPRSPRPSPSLRRTSSAASFHQKPPPSPTLSKKSSRSSLRTPAEDVEKRPSPKRSISNLIAGLREAHSKMEVIEEPIQLTASQIAQKHFTRELSIGKEAGESTGTAVIIHDACYGHRYSRLKTTKSILSFIVERPERLLASVLGVSAAYVRLGGHHAGGRNAPHPEKAYASSSPFRITRTERMLDITSPYVTAIHGIAWMAELQAMCDLAASRLAIGAKELERSSAPDQAEKRKLHEGDLYLCAESLSAMQGALGGVADAIDTAFAPGSQTKRVFVAVRPPGHHCSADYPSGFCWLNNVHIGIQYASQIYGLTHAAILDFDLHHGDGSQAITWKHNSMNNMKRLNAKPNSKLKLGPDIGYYSIHDINSYPCEEGDDEKVQAASLCIDDAHGQSIWNVHLQPWKTEAEFWQLYESQYLVLLDKARKFLERHTTRLRAEGKIRPQAAIFISAGFDASEWEGQGMQRHKVNVPTEFYARITRDIVNLAQETGTGCDGKVISVLEGGYSDRALCSGVLSHLSGFCATQPRQQGGPADAAALDRLMQGLAINTASQHLTYDQAWWSPENLTALEHRVNPPPPAPAKKARSGQQPTYATPTESFAYKVVDANKFARSISGTMRETPKIEPPPIPPPPEVDWVTATHELSKILVPTDRQTRSCTAEELGGVRVKKERQSVAPVLTAEESVRPRQLRDRKAKLPGLAETMQPQSDRRDSLESINRRQTISAIPSSDVPIEPPKQRRQSRRLSAGSTLSSMSSEVDPNAPPVPAIPVSAASVNGRESSSAFPPPSLPVRKTRLPAPAPPPAKIPKKPALPASAPTSPSNAKKSFAPSQPSHISAGSAGKDVDALTTGMKKFTLKVGTREEHDRKQKEKLDAERRARALKAAETRKVNAAARKAAQATAGQGAVPSGAVAKPSLKENGGIPTPSAEAIIVSRPPDKVLHPEILPPENHDVVTVGDERLETLPSSAPLNTTEYASMPIDTTGIPPTTDQGEAAHNPDRANIHSEPPSMKLESQGLHYQQETVLPSIPDPMTASSTPNTAFVQVGQEEPVKHEFFRAGPSYSYSSPVRPRSRDELPVWSSTGAIPFAPTTTTAPGSYTHSAVTAPGEQNIPPWVVEPATTTSDSSGQQTSNVNDSNA